jgi:hypothetical protein
LPRTPSQKIVTFALDIHAGLERRFLLAVLADRRDRRSARR